MYGDYKSITEASLGHHWLRWVTRLGEAGFIDGKDSELVFEIFDQVHDFSLADGLARLNNALPHATAVLVTLLDGVPDDGCTAIVSRFLPRQLEMSLTPVNGLWVTRSARYRC